MDAPAQTVSNGTILIVDDMPANLEVVTSHLERRGYRALVALSGEEGIERADYVLPDLILLDVMMPGTDGFEICRRLKSDERTRTIPVIFMTALADTADKLEGFAAGAVDYVTKPLDGAEVLARIETHLALYALRRQLAEQNARLQQEIVVRAEAEAALQRSNTEFEQLAYVASHDMQEPLRKIASYLQLLSQRYQGKLDADADEFIGYAVDGAKRMQALINDLLAFSRVGTKAKPFALTDCNQIMRTALADLEFAIEECGAQVDVGHLPVVMGDATQLSQLFRNLLSNAMKFRRQIAPIVRVSAERSDAGWRFAVSDNGMGIAPEYFERIFVIFQRLHGRAKYPGTGIGLAICKKIVQRHGGQIEVRSVEGEGSVFEFTLPAVPSPTGD